MLRLSFHLVLLGPQAIILLFQMFHLLMFTMSFVLCFTFFHGQHLNLILEVSNLLFQRFWEPAWTLNRPVYGFLFCRTFWFHFLQFENILLTRSTAQRWTHILDICWLPWAFYFWNDIIPGWSYGIAIFANLSRRFLGNWRGLERHILVSCNFLRNLRSSFRLLRNCYRWLFRFLSVLNFDELGLFIDVVDLQSGWWWLGHSLPAWLLALRTSACLRRFGNLGAHRVTSLL